MSAAAALKAARDAGIELGIDGDDLLLEAVSEPPTATIEDLSRHKAEIIELLRPNKDSWSAEDWRLYFEERAAIAESDGGLPRAKAEAQAFECCVDEWLNRNPTPSAPGHCAWCGQSESHHAVVPLERSREPGCTASAGRRGGKCVHSRRRKLWFEWASAIYRTAAS
jgi:hypothetical protein